MLVSLSANAFDFDSYTGSSLDKIIEQHEDDFGEDFDIGISGIAFKYKITALFTKNLRAVSDERKSFLKHWATSLGQDNSFIAKYQHEFLIEASGYKIWLPMQESVLPFMGEELIEGQEFEIYFVLAGIDHGEWVFLGTEFQAW
tara:strand:+ start:91 stop:522 length:432 start_codon:yes stop_codon:yes gene_type:complete